MPSRNGHGAEKGLQILTRKDQPSLEEWIELIKDRLRRLKPLLKNFSLERLGDFRVLLGSDDHGNECHGLFKDTEDVVAYTVIKDTQGIFGMLPWANTRFDWADSHSNAQVVANGERMFWGLTRDSQWIVVRVTYDHDSLYEKATNFHVKAVELEQFLEEIRIEPERLCLELSRALQKFYEARKRLLEDVEAVKVGFDAEDALLHLILDSQ